MQKVRSFRRGICALLSIGVCLSATASLAAVVGSTAVTVDATPIYKDQALTGRATVSTTQTGSLQLTINWVDNYGRVADQQVSTITTPGQASCTFSFPAQVGLTMLNRISVSAVFPANGNTLSGSSADWELVPDPLDHEDYYANVWGDGNASSANYFSAIAQGSVTLGHIYRDVTVNHGYNFSGATFYGPLYNVRPNHDFLENKIWFEMTDAMHNPNYNAYTAALSAKTYYQPANRNALIRPASLSSASALSDLVNNITPRMQLTKKWRPMQWNIADEYGLGRRDYPFDYDLGPDCISQFITWLQGQYGTIEALNTQWGTHFTAFSDLSNPINAPQYGEAALIVTQEMKDREYPLYTNTTGAKNFSPWSDFRRHMELTMANAMQRCVDAARGIDPTVPIGWEGGETATALSGYDYSLQMPRMGSFEAYDLSNSPEYARSFRDNQYGEPLFRWITMFDTGSPVQNRYHLWFDMIHYGQRASIIWWDQNYFVDETGYALTSYAQGLAPAYQEFGAGLAKLLSQGEPDDGQIALYYSQRSVHVSWMYDSETLGTGWAAQLSGDRRIQSILYAQTGWLKALEDIGLKGRFVSYDQITSGVLLSKGYKVLIMPRIMAMSSEEIAAVQAFANAGGVVIADSQTALFDGHGKRRAITDGGGLMDSWFGIQRTSYHSTERKTSSSDAYSGSVTLQPPPAGFEPLVSGLGSVVSDGWHAVEDGVQVLDGAAAGLFGNDPAKPVLIVKNHGAGKSVYTNVTLMRYGRTGGNYTEERKNPSSSAAQAVRQLVKNLVALAGVTPRVRVLRGFDADPQATLEVYDLEKARFVDGQNVYLACIVNSQMESTDWSAASDPGGTLFGDSGTDNAQVSLLLDQPAYVYNVRNKLYMGYGTQFNTHQHVFEGDVFALLAYRVAQLRVDSLSFDAKHRATIRASVRTVMGTPGRHVLRLVVRNSGGSEIVGLTRNIVAPAGVWADTIPFAVSDVLLGYTITLTDMATGDQVSVPASTIYAEDIDGDGHVDVVDLLYFAASFGANQGDPAYDLRCDYDNSGGVDVLDLLYLVDDFGA